MAMTVLRVQVPMMATVLEAWKGMQMNLYIGDKVRVGRASARSRTSVRSSSR